jgi:predicted MFS family arabinose efflux permease
MGIYGTNMPVAIIIAFPTATVLGQNFGWRYPFYVGAAVSLVAALVFVVAVREGPLKGEPRPVKLSEVKRAVGSGEVWKAGMIWLFFETTTIGFLTWAPKLFQRFKGLEPLYASLLASVVMYSAVFFVPLFGWASDKVGRRKPFIVAGSVSMALTLISIAYANDVGLFFSVFALGISAATIPPLAMAVVAESLPPRLSGTGFGIVTLCQNVGITLSAPLAGYLLQTTQSLLLTFFGMSLFAFAGTVTALTIKTK